MTNVLIPVDGSENSKRAVQFALERQRREPGLDIHLLNVQLPIRGDEVNKGPIQEAIRRMHETAAEQALKPAEDLLKAGGVRFAKHFEVGDIAESIAKYAKDQRIDEIVMGTRGMSAIGNLVMGSVATKVIHVVDIPITLVK